MLPIRLGLASRSSSVALRDLISAATAIGVQITRDLKPIWDIEATISALPDPDVVPPGVWPVYVVDDTGDEGAAGLHLSVHRQPYALVEAGPTWSLTASHECLEMLVDPSGNRLVSSAGVAIENGAVVDLPDAKFEYLVEVADPSEGPGNAYMIDGVLVSDFYTPHFFDPSPASGVRYSFSGKITRPRQILQGGYLSWVNPALGRMQQLRWLDPQPVIVDIPGEPSASDRRTLRGFVDQHVDQETKSRRALSHLEPESPQVKRQASRSQWLVQASAVRGDAFPLSRRKAAVGPTPVPDQAQKVLDKHLDQIKRAGGGKAAGATRAYVGWRFENDWITRDRAIVVLAAPMAVQRVRNSLPAVLDGVPVEVRADPRPVLPGPLGALSFASAAPGSVREELAVPSFPKERVFVGPVEAEGAAARRREPFQYRPPESVSLDTAVFDVENMILHVSPEQGWAQLAPFLKGTKRKLVVGMYEFTAPHIDEAVRGDLGGMDTLTLTLDSPPERAGKREQTVEQTREDLESALEARLTFAWALSGLGTKAPEEAFPTAYHIKVAVQDTSAFWLSSGNWNTSNQPAVDPNDDQALTEAIRTNDRDWHVICDCPELAKIFEAFLLNDNAQAQEAAKEAAQAAAAGAAGAATAAAGPAGVAALEAPRAAPLPLPLSPTEALALSSKTPKAFFQPRTVNGRMKITPLLTPDSYRVPILKLIKSAKARFYMQTQYIHTTDNEQPVDGQPTHMDLIAAVADIISRGVDVKLITSEYQTKPWIEKLQDAGVDATNHLRIQRNVHNKGIIVDSEVCVVSSQNWSGQGTGSNRDAGLIIYNADAAQYFEQIFLHDWVNLASHSAMA